MRITINLPEDLHERVAVDALKKRRNSKEAVIAEILRAHYGGGQREEKIKAALDWRLDSSSARGIMQLRSKMRKDWKP